MAETDDYRGNLAACWRMAEKASNDVEKRAWLEMAEGWKLLIISGCEGSAVNDVETASHEIDRRGHTRRWDTGLSFALSRVLDGSPAWLAGTISSALQLNDTICEISRSRWFVGVGWWQERGFEIFCSVHYSLVQLIKQCLTEGRALARPTFIKYLFRSKESSERRCGKLQRDETSAPFPANLTQSPDAKDKRADALSFFLTMGAQK